MENVTKALLIAAGMFLTVLLASMVVLFYNRISSFYEQQYEFTVIEQTEKFNAQFENYHRDGIRGNELISFMNKVINYNATESYFEDKSYKRIGVTIILGNNKEDLNKFKYQQDSDIYSREFNEYLNDVKITNMNSTGDNWSNDKKLIAITNTPFYLCELAEEKNIHNVTDTKLQQLASGIANIIVDESKNESTDRTARFKRGLLIEDVLGIDVLEVGKNQSIPNDCKIAIDASTGITLNHGDGKDIIENIKNITNQYYQYMQFKRACFDCTSIKYDKSTNRVVEMTFQVQTDDSGNVIFD